MNLHSIVGPIVSAINPTMKVTVRVSTGYTTSASGKRTPTYAPDVVVGAQVQPVSFRDLQQLDGLNLNGTRRVIYIFGDLQGLSRPTNQGGDLVVMPDGSVWLVAMVLEGFNPTAGWTKAAITLQNGS